MCYVAECSEPNGNLAALLYTRHATECLRHDSIIGVRRDVLAGYTAWLDAWHPTGMFAALPDARNSTGYLRHCCMLGTQWDVCSVSGRSACNRIFAALQDVQHATECLRHDSIIGVRRDVLVGYLLGG